MLRSRLIILGGCLALIGGNSSAQDADAKVTVQRKLCNTLAKSRYVTDKIDSDVAKLPSMTLSDIKHNNALIYCRISFRNFPDDPMIMHHLGRAELAELNTERGLVLVNESAQLNYVPAMIDLAILYAQGRGMGRDYDKAAAWFKKAAQTGHPQAMIYTGLSYIKGLGVDKDYKAAFEWFTKAYEGSNYPEASYQLGIMYEEGLGREIDSIKAVDFYQQAAEGGVQAALYKLYIFYKYGIFVQKDKKMAEYYQRLYENSEK